MKKLKYISLLTLVVLITFTQCRKDKKEFVPFCEEFPEQCVDMERIKDHYYFKTGSWWIYQEVTSHQLDSQWVSQSWVSDCNFSLTIKSSLDDYDRERWTHLLTPAKNCGRIEKLNFSRIERSKYKPGDFKGTSYIGIFYPTIGDSAYNSNAYYLNNYIKVENILEELLQLNYSFNNVIEYFEYSNKTENNQSVKTFYAEGVGLIKKELIDSNQTWLLIDYNVEQ